MPESIKKFLTNLSDAEFVAVWTYFDSNVMAMTEMTDVLVATHPNAEAPEKETT